jgi:hypothetical protein
MLLDFSRQRVTLKTMDMLFGTSFARTLLPTLPPTFRVSLLLSLDLAETANVRGKIKAFASGDKVNPTEGRAAGHMALRACADSKVSVLSACQRHASHLFWLCSGDLLHGGW